MGIDQKIITIMESLGRVLMIGQIQEIRICDEVVEMFLQMDIVVPITPIDSDRVL
jgi:hypothetical protein